MAKQETVYPMATHDLHVEVYDQIGVDELYEILVKEACTHFFLGSENEMSVINHNVRNYIINNRQI